MKKSYLIIARKIELSEVRYSYNSEVEEEEIEHLIQLHRVSEGYKNAYMDALREICGSDNVEINVLK